MFPDRAIAELRESTVRDIALELLELQGRRVADIGCGDGAFTNFLASGGASVTGIDPDQHRIRAARTSGAAAGSAAGFAIGVAQTLPFADASMDIAIFSNSLHHVPVEFIAAALAEANRVLKGGGLLYVTEPVPSGASFDVQRLWNDETEVRQRAYDALSQPERWGLDARRELFFAHPARYRDFAEYAAERWARGGDHAAAMAEIPDQIRQRFDAHARREDSAFVLDRATRVNLFSKLA